MRTAEQWMQEAPTCQDSGGCGSYAYGEITLDEDFIKRVQLDAYKAGMTRAAEIADENQMDRQTKNDISKRILTTRDSLTELPL